MGLFATAPVGSARRSDAGPAGPCGRFGQNFDATWIGALLFAVLLGGCASAFARKPSTHEELEQACRDRAGYYGESAPVYARCMHDRGFLDATEADY